MIREAANGVEKGMALPHAVILAGGKGERLGGVRKAELRVGGVRLIDRVAATLEGVAMPLMLSTGPETDRRIQQQAVTIVPDLPAPLGGPLAGLAGAVADLARRGVASGLLVSVAVDTPFLPWDFVARMVTSLGQKPSAYAAWGTEFYPPNAVWQIAALADLPRLVLEGAAPASLKQLHGQLGARRVDWADRHDANPFANLNTVADLLALQRMARG